VKKTEKDLKLEREKKIKEQRKNRKELIVIGSFFIVCVISLLIADKIGYLKNPDENLKHSKKETLKNNSLEYEKKAKNTIVTVKKKSSKKSGDSIKEQVIRLLNKETLDLTTCLKILNENNEKLKNRAFDSTLAKTILNKISSEKLSFNIDGKNVKIKGKLSKCIVVNSLKISLREYSERNLLSFWKKDYYPIVEISVKCRVVKRMIGSQYNRLWIIKDSVKLMNNLNEPIFDFKDFQVQSENIDDYLDSEKEEPKYHKTDPNKIRYVKLQGKLWDENLLKNSKNKILNRSQKLVSILAISKNLQNVNLELFFDSWDGGENDRNNGNGGETIYTGSRGGKYVIRNGKKRYIPRN
jgi:hypothetical protein